MKRVQTTLVTFHFFLSFLLTFLKFIKKKIKYKHSFSVFCTHLIVLFLMLMFSLSLLFFLGIPLRMELLYPLKEVLRKKTYFLTNLQSLLYRQLRHFQKLQHLVDLKSRKIMIQNIKGSSLFSFPFLIFLHQNTFLSRSIPCLIFYLSKKKLKNINFNTLNFY